MRGERWSTFQERVDYAGLPRVEDALPEETTEFAATGAGLEVGELAMEGDVVVVKLVDI